MQSWVIWYNNSSIVDSKRKAQKKAQSSKNFKQIMKLFTDIETDQV